MKPLVYCTKIEIALRGALYPSCLPKRHNDLMLKVERVLDSNGHRHYPPVTISTSPLIQVDVANQLFETRNYIYQLISPDMVEALFLLHPTEGTNHD